jgi:hypothetical protein
MAGERAVATKIERAAATKIEATARGHETRNFFNPATCDATAAAAAAAAAADPADPTTAIVKKTRQLTTRTVV